MECLRRVLGVTLCDKKHRSDIRKAQHVKPLPRIDRSQLCWFGHVSNVPGKNGELSPSGYRLHPRERGPKFVQDQVAWLHLRPCLVPSWCGASRTIWDCCWLWGISGPPRAAAPASLPKGKAGTKTNKWMSVKAYNEPFYLWNCLVCLPKVNVVFKQLSIFWRKLSLFVKMI